MSFFYDVDEPCCGRLALEQLAELAPRLASEPRTPHLVFCRERPHLALKRPGGRRQVKIRVASLSQTLDQSRVVLLFLFAGQPPSEELRRDECYIIEPSQWNAATFLPADRCRVFHLDRLCLLVPSFDQQQQQQQQDSSPSLQLVWREADPDELFANPVGTSLVRYLQLLADLALQPKLAPALSVRQILDEYAAYRRITRREHSHGEAVLAFLYGVTRYVHEKTRLHTLLERVIQTEALLQTERQIDEITLWEFVYASCVRLPVWLTQYRLDEADAVYWSIDQNNNRVRYTVHGDWLLKMPGYRTDITALNGGGAGCRLALDEAAFTQHFLPALRRELLLDLFAWVRRGGKRAFLDNLLDAVLPAYETEEAQRDLFDALPIGRTHVSLETCYDFACEYGSPGTLTVETLERRLAHIEYNKTHQQPVTTPSLRLSTEAVERDALPDIENLVASLPPCLRLILAEPGRHLANMDRYNATAYLSELQYSKEEIVEYLTPLNASSGGNPIASNYDSFQRLRARNRSNGKTTGRYDTLSCNAVIGKETAQRDVFRCPYARQAKKKQGRDYTEDEKRDCRSQCYEERFGLHGQFYHPLDYVYATVNKRTQ